MMTVDVDSTMCRRYLVSISYRRDTEITHLKDLNGNIYTVVEADGLYEVRMFTITSACVVLGRYATKREANIYAYQSAHALD